MNHLIFANLFMNFHYKCKCKRLGEHFMANAVITICGTAIEINECLRPIRSVSHPITMVPAKPPIPSIEPIHASSLSCTRPDGSGELSESYKIKTFAIHPIDIA